MDPTLKKHPKATTTTSHPPITKNPDPKLTSKPFHNMSKHLSKLYPHHKVCTNTLKPTNNQPPPPPPSIHAHLQAKAMTVSADFDASSKLSLIRPTHQYCRSTVEPKVEKEISRTADESKEASKEKVKKLSSMELVGKKKVQQLLGNEKRHHKKKEVNDKKEVKDLMFEGHDEDIIKRMSVLPLSIGGGRRRSLCGSQVELGDFLAGNGAKIVSVDMPPFMQIHAVDCARKTCDSLEKFTSKTLALSLKKEFDGVYGPAWHCIVGTSFGSFVTHSVGGFLYFSMDQKLYILLFKTTVQRAD